MQLTLRSADSQASLRDRLICARTLELRGMASLLKVLMAGVGVINIEHPTLVRLACGPPYFHRRYPIAGTAGSLKPTNALTDEPFVYRCQSMYQTYGSLGRSGLEDTSLEVYYVGQLYHLADEIFATGMKEPTHTYLTIPSSRTLLHAALTSACQHMHARVCRSVSHHE